MFIFRKSAKVVHRNIHDSLPPRALEERLLKIGIEYFWEDSNNIKSHRNESPPEADPPSAENIFGKMVMTSNRIALRTFHNILTFLSL
jgi:hypothetical protein